MKCMDHIKFAFLLLHSCMPSMHLFFHFYMFRSHFTEPLSVQKKIQIGMIRDRPDPHRQHPYIRKETYVQDSKLVFLFFFFFANFNAAQEYNKSWSSASMGEWKLTKVTASWNAFSFGFNFFVSLQNLFCLSQNFASFRRKTIV